MYVIADALALSTLQDAQLRRLLSQRAQEVAEAAEDTWEGLVYFLVLEPHDTATTAEDALGFSLLERPHELIEEHDDWFEFVFVLSDDGSGVEVLMPKHAGIDPALLAWCAAHSFRSSTSPRSLNPLLPLHQPSPGGFFVSGDRMTPIEPVVAELVAKLSPHLREDFQERAAIIEYEASTPRQLAECLALLDVLRRYPSALLGLQAFRGTFRECSCVFLAEDRASLHERLGAAGLADVQETDLAAAVADDLGGIALVARAS